jgi:hypothetical protein
MPTLNPLAIKRDNEALILTRGGQICDWLPHLDPDTPPRDAAAIARRALVLNAMIQIAFRAPTPVIKTWIEANGLTGDLAASERAILAKPTADLTEQERTNLLWSLEALWAFAWIGGLIDDLPYREPVGDTLASLCPDLRQNESVERFVRSWNPRPHAEVFRMLDLYFRLHWWTRDADLRGEPSGDASLDVITERRKALEWAMDAEQDWDRVEMST